VARPEHVKPRSRMPNALVGGSGGARTVSYTPAEVPRWDLGAPLWWHPFIARPLSTAGCFRGMPCFRQAEVCSKIEHGVSILDVQRSRRQHGVPGGQTGGQCVPNRTTHTSAGAAAGALAAWWLARDEPRPLRAVEVLGGLVGGAVGGRLPDELEPAELPGHRGFAHSVVFAGVAAAMLGRHRRLRRVQAFIRQQAEWCRWRQQVATTGWGVGRWWGEHWGWWLASGALVGFVAGYASHLVLDAMTPAGLPILA